jgi:TolB protein
VAIVEYENPENYITITSETNPLLQDWPYILDSAFDLISLAVQENPLIGFTLYLFSNSTPIWINNDSEIIFIAANSEENAVLFIVKADGSDLREFIPGLPGISGLPTLSPDGKTFAFIRYPKWKNTSRVEIALFDLNTSELKSLVVLPEPDNGDQLLISGLDWTSDGEFLAFSSNHEGRSNIYVISKDGERWINLTENMHGDAVSPAWKP